MSPSVRLGFRFAYAAAAAMGIVILTSGIVGFEPFFPPYWPPSFKVAAFITFATFGWSYVFSAGTASALAGIENVPAAHAFIAGALFAVLTLVVVKFTFNGTDDVTAVVSMLIWSVGWPVVSVLAIWRLERPNTSLERTRER